MVLGEKFNLNYLPFHFETLNFKNWSLKDLLMSSGMMAEKDLKCVAVLILPQKVMCISNKW